MKFLLAAVIVAVALAAGIWLVVIRGDLIVEQVQKALAKGGLSAEINGFRKGLFFDFHVRSVELRKSGEPLLTIEELSGRANPLSLLALKLPLSFMGKAGSGVVSGSIELMKRNALIAFDNVRMEGVPLFQLLGLKGAGTVSGEIKGAGGGGTARFAIRDMRLERYAFFGLQLPLELFYSANGAMTFGGGTLKMDSLFLEGKDISARIKGVVIGNRMDLTLEIMKDSSFVDTSGLLPLIEGYRVSAGYYSIPIKGDLPF